MTDNMFDKSSIGVLSVSTKTVSVIITPVKNCNIMQGEIINAELISEVIYPSKKMIEVVAKNTGNEFAYIEAAKLKENVHQIVIDNKKYIVLNIIEN